MSVTLQSASLRLVAITAFLLAGHAAHAQDNFERLRSPAIVRSFIGGESHDSYVIRARAGQLMAVQISWRRVHNEVGDNHAEFFVSDSPEFSGDGEVKFGKTSNRGKRWRGKIPKTGNYYIYVVAHPTAHYTLRVTVR